jgi:hypothetical protein
MNSLLVLFGKKHYKLDFFRWSQNILSYMNILRSIHLDNKPTHSAVVEMGKVLLNGTPNLLAMHIRIQ